MPVAGKPAGHRYRVQLGFLSPGINWRPRHSDGAVTVHSFTGPSKPSSAPNTGMATSQRVSVIPEPEWMSRHPQQPALPDLDHLMNRVAAGDHNAFATLYDAVAPRAYGL